MAETLLARAGGRERDEGRRGETTPLSLRSFSCVRPVVRDFRTVAGLVDVLCDVGGIFGRFGGCAFGGDACAVVGAFGGRLVCRPGKECGVYDDFHAGIIARHGEAYKREFMRKIILRAEGGAGRLSEKSPMKSGHLGAKNIFA